MRVVARRHRLGEDLAFLELEDRLDAAQKRVLHRGERASATRFGSAGWTSSAFLRSCTLGTIHWRGDAVGSVGSSSSSSSFFAQ